METGDNLVKKGTDFACAPAKSVPFFVLPALHLVPAIAPPAKQHKYAPQNKVQNWCKLP